jgi:hypothetical protein
MAAVGLTAIPGAASNHVTAQRRKLQFILLVGTLAALLTKENKMQPALCSSLLETSQFADQIRHGINLQRSRPSFFLVIERKKAHVHLLYEEERKPSCVLAPGALALAKWPRPTTKPPCCWLALQSWIRFHRVASFCSFSASALREKN